MRWAISPSSTRKRITPRTATSWSLTAGVQRVGDHDPVAVGDHVLDVVAQPGESAEEAGQAAAVLVAIPMQPLPSAAVCSLTKSSVTWATTASGSPVANDAR